MRYYIPCHISWDGNMPESIDSYPQDAHSTSGNI